MASKKEVKEQIKSYILENYSRLSEEDKDGDGIEDEVDAVVDEPAAKEDPLSAVDSVQAIKKLLDNTQTRVSTELKDITLPKTKLKIIGEIVDFIMSGFNTTADLPNATLRNFFIRKFGGDDGEETSIQFPDEPVSEESTTAGAPAPATKYAFRRKKK